MSGRDAEGGCRDGGFPGVGGVRPSCLMMTEGVNKEKTIEQMVKLTSENGRIWEFILRKASWAQFRRRYHYRRSPQEWVLSRKSEVRF
jgi:hypothetical protein